MTQSVTKSNAAPSSACTLQRQRKKYTCRIHDGSRSGVATPRISFPPGARRPHRKRATSTQQQKEIYHFLSNFFTCRNKIFILKNCRFHCPIEMGAVLFSCFFFFSVAPALLFLLNLVVFFRSKEKTLKTRAHKTKAERDAYRCRLAAPGHQMARLEFQMFSRAKSNKIYTKLKNKIKKTPNHSLFHLNVSYYAKSARHVASSASSTPGVGTEREIFPKETHSNHFQNARLFLIFFFLTS